MENKQNKTIFTVITLVAVAILMVLIFIVGSVNAEFGSDSITLSATLTAKQKILFSEIESVELKDNISVGSRSCGVGGGKISAGNFKNNEYGDYKLFAYSNVKKFIVIKTAKVYFVYNLKTASLTQSSYENLLTKLNI